MERLKAKEKLNALLEDFNRFISSSSASKYLSGRIPGKSVEFYQSIKPYLPEMFNSIIWCGITYFVVPSYIASKLAEIATLDDDFFPKSVKKVKIPPEIEFDEPVSVVEQGLDERIKELATEFIDIIRLNFSEKSMKNLCRNLHSITVQQIEEKINSNTDTIVVANYIPSKNILSFSSFNDYSTIFHELFHVASSYYDYERRIDFSGFHQLSIAKFIDIGRSINEGYTELLTERYSRTPSTSGYGFDKYIASIIEKIVGMEKMQSLYLAADLKGLIDELSKYVTYKEIMTLISSLDFLLIYSYSKTKLLTKKTKIDNCFTIIDWILYKARMGALSDKISNLRESKSSEEIKSIVESELNDLLSERVHIFDIYYYDPMPEIADETLMKDILEKLGYKAIIVNGKLQSLEEASVGTIEEERVSGYARR